MVSGEWGGMSGGGTTGLQDYGTTNDDTRGDSRRHDDTTTGRHDSRTTRNEGRMTTGGGRERPQQDWMRWRKVSWLEYSLVAGIVQPSFSVSMISRCLLNYCISLVGQWLEYRLQRESGRLVREVGQRKLLRWQ